MINRKTVCLIKLSVDCWILCPTCSFSFIQGSCSQLWIILSLRELFPMFLQIVLIFHNRRMGWGQYFRVLTLMGTGESLCSPITKNYPVQIINSAQLEKTWSMRIWGDSKIKPQLTSSQLPPNHLIHSSSRNFVHFCPLLFTSSLGPYFL